MMGLHPCHVDDDWEAECAPILAASDAHPASQGEIGMDLFRAEKRETHQIAAFHAQSRMGALTDLPVVLHVRDAFEDTFAVLDQSTRTPLYAVSSCFTGGCAEAEKVVDMAVLLRTGRRDDLQEWRAPMAVPHLPQDRILLETDSPYLAPDTTAASAMSRPTRRSWLQRVADLLERPLARMWRP